MATREIKKIGNNKATVQPAHNTWGLIKPFVHFGLKAIGLIASTLITIVKNIPKPNNHKHPERKDNNIIKI
jgi:hypothetical protein